ncbi:hypothetical protein GGI35DRAFT_163767 [Trichoderma velutinum]
MGAMHSPYSPLSLDQQLLEATDILEQIKRQLNEIIEAIDDLTTIVQYGHLKSNAPLDLDICTDLASILGLDPIDEGDEFSLNEITVALRIVSKSIDSLFQLGMLVKKSASCERFKPALRNSEPAFPGVTDIDYVKKKHIKLRSGRLILRLGSAIAKRRQFLKYYREHRSRPGVDESDHNAATSPNFRSEEIFEEDYDNVSSSNASMMADSTSNLALPRLADIARTQQPFECPICFALQSFDGEKSWQIHAFRDLKAYVCTLGGAECDSELFEDRDAWFEHELRKHRCEYRCTLCSSGTFSFESLAAHIQNTHGLFSDRQLNMLREGGRQNSIQFKAKDCPFCDELTKAPSSSTNRIGDAFNATQDVFVTHIQFKKHVAMHQEQLAILALRQATDNEDISSAKSDKSLSAAISESPFEMDVDPIDKLIDESHGDPVPNINISVTDELNDTISAATNVDEIGVAEQPIPGLVSKYDEGPQKITKSVENRRPDKFVRKSFGGAMVNTWRCCKCGLGGLIAETTPQCSELDCQHPRCQNCTIYRDSVGPSRLYK